MLPIPRRDFNACVARYKGDYRCLTNHLGYEALTIAELYRECWNVELFFKRIKQHLHIKSFYGTSENAVYAQIWFAVCSFLILALAKKSWGYSNHCINSYLFFRIPINPRCSGTGTSSTALRQLT